MNGHTPLVSGAQRAGLPGTHAEQGFVLGQLEVTGSARGGRQRQDIGSCVQDPASLGNTQPGEVEALSPGQGVHPRRGVVARWVCGVPGSCAGKC